MTWAHIDKASKKKLPLVFSFPDFFKYNLCRLIQRSICNLPLGLKFVVFSAFAVIQCQSFPLTSVFP